MMPARSGVIRHGPSRVQIDTARQILAMIARQGLEPGDHITEQKVVDDVGVSRTPVRRALGLLAESGLLERRVNRGYFLCAGVDTATRLLDLPPTEDEALYLEIARDWFERRLPEAVTEIELRRRYDAGRHALGRVLIRLAEDEILVRGPGQGWTFQPTLNQESAHDASYRFRQAIEPAAIMEPSFRLDDEGARRCRSRHERVLHRDLDKVPISLMFEIDAEFHAVVARSSSNRFFAAAVERQNRLRRLVEYFAPTDKTRLAQSCAEHLAILDALSRNRREEAAAMMRHHLELASTIKPDFRPDGASTKDDADSGGEG